MDINEILNYKDKFSQSAFLEKISRIAKRRCQTYLCSFDLILYASV